MLTFFRKQIGTVLFVSAIVLSLAAPHRTVGHPAANKSREKIGEVLGKPVYREEIHTGRDSQLQDELFRLFLNPVTQRYYAAHKAEIEPTQAEIEIVAAFFQKNGFEGNDPEEPSEAQLRLQLKEVKTQLAAEKLSKRRQDHLELKKQWIKQKLDDLPTGVEKYISAIQNVLSALNKNFDKIVFAVRKRGIDWLMAEPNLTKEERDALNDLKKIIEIDLDPDRTFAVFVLANWKFERHLYDEFGGGRVLWQQMGLEAFDANRRWLEAEEKNGNFKFTDPKLRDAFYRYWRTQSHGPYMIEDEATIRKEFLEPKWAPRRAK